MSNIRALLAASFYLCFLLAVNATAQDQTLQVGSPIERQLAGGQTHTFSVRLDENAYIQLVVEQRGIDVVVNVAGPDGKSFGKTDTPNGTEGPENVSFVGTTAGAYRIIVTPLNNDASAGKYEIKIIEVREATEQELQSGKNMEGIKEKGLALFAEAENLMQQIRTPATRIRSQLQAAQMLWELDEKRASKFLNDAASGLTELLATFDSMDQSYMIEYSGITQLRHEILQFMAARDPDAALSFLQASKLPGNPYGNKREMESQDNALELMIADQIVARDPKRAFELARKKLKTGYSHNLINTIVLMKRKDAELATQLANELVGKLLQEQLLKQPEAANLSVGLIYSCRSREVTGPRTNRRGAFFVEQLLSPESCRDLLQKAFDTAMSFTPPVGNTYAPERDAASNLLRSLQQLGAQLNETIGGGQASVEKKFNDLNAAANPYQSMFHLAAVQMNGSVEEAVQAIEKAPEEVREQLYFQLANTAAARGDGEGARKIINEHVSNPYQRRQALANLDQQEMYQAMSRGKAEDALKAIALLRTPRERANMLMQIARVIGPGYKRSAAINLLDQARNLLAPGLQAQDQEQMNALIELARAFARYDVKRAFDIVDPLIDQFNELCAAGRALQGFGLEYYKNEELEMINGNNLTSIAINLSSALGTLALINFERAKTSADRLRLPEVRLRAYLDIAQRTIQPTRRTNEWGGGGRIIHLGPRM